MCKGNFLNSETVTKILENDFDDIDIEECCERFMARSNEMLVEAEIELIKHRNKCRQRKEYTPEDIRKALRFYNCILCSLNSFV